MADIMSKETRSRVMSRIRGTDTTPELQLKSLLESAGLEFERHKNELPGKPDFVFPEQRMIVFVDGDFWHGWRFPIWEHRMSPKWRNKIAETRRRDRRTHQRLRRMGWTVLRVWEHQMQISRLDCAEKIVNALALKNEVNWTAVEACEAELPKIKRRNKLPRP